MPSLNDPNLQAYNDLCGKQMISEIKSNRSCNPHSDCDKAEEEVLARKPGKFRSDISPSFHCHDDECEDCFGC